MWTSGFICREHNAIYCSMNALINLTHRDTMPCCEICKGMFFFFYCPLLPLFWMLEYVWVFAKNKWRRHKRKKRFRKERAAKQAEKEKTYLMLDKYSRGKIEREILDFSKDLKEQRQKRKKKGLSMAACLSKRLPSIGHKSFDIPVIILNASHWSNLYPQLCTEIEGFNPDTEDIADLGGQDDEGEPSQRESSDTTDADEAGDIDELVNPGDPVYFNYATSENTPPSLIVCSKTPMILVQRTTKYNNYNTLRCDDFLCCLESGQEFQH